MKKYIIVFIATLTFFVNIPFCASAYSACSMVLMEKSTQTILIDINCNKILPMASTTKIMTALVVLERAKLDDTVKIPQEAVGVEGSSMYLIAGEKMTVSDLLYGLMLTSGNDAATALALYVGKTEQGFVDMMNVKAKDMGLTSTHFANPSGLPDDNHFTTARELAIITANALNNEVFAKIVSSKTAKVPYNDNPGGRTLKNHNKLLVMYDSAIGVKTGFTKKAGRCLVSAAQDNGITLICVTLNDSDDWKDHITAFDYGFSKAKPTCLAKPGEISINLVTPDGRTVSASNKTGIDTVIFDDTPITRSIKAENFVYAPKCAGDKVGEVCFYINDSLTITLDLCLDQSIEAPKPKKELLITKIIRMIKSLFKGK